MHVYAGISGGAQERARSCPTRFIRYPAELIDIVRGAGGERIMLRPVLPQDAELMQDFVRSLSAEARRNRFFRTLHELPAALLDRFTSIDYHDHLALLASVLVKARKWRLGKAATWCRSRGSPSSPSPSPMLGRVRVSGVSSSSVSNAALLWRA
jgi:hypothetical protein